MSTKHTKNPVNSRLLLLKEKLELGQNEFCSAAKISTATFHSIKNGVELRPRTVRNICEALKANQDFIFNGVGDLFLPKEDTTSADSSLLQKALAKLEEQLNKSNAQVEKLTNIIFNLTSTGPGSEKNIQSFLKALNGKTGSLKQNNNGLLRVA